ncbi:hypothetical protein LEP1GSC086_3027 [Leptospira weilii str. LNT 1234]|nr:hypothetical protein LEP1GSC086_3027 [Leptospira weilii str. LNT 1234]
MLSSDVCFLDSSFDLKTKNVFYARILIVSYTFLNRLYPV